MINIQRNFFIENILFEANIDTYSNYNQIPYKDYIDTSINDEKILFLIDIDRIKKIDIFEKDLNSYKKKNNKIIFVPISKNKNKLDKFVNRIEKLNYTNLIVINFNNLGVKRTIDLKREKIFKTYLSLDITLVLSKVIKNLLELINNKDIRLVSLDLDNTCWTGVIGEDGINKIFLDDYQKKSLNLIDKLITKTGLVLSFHSKNNEKIALKGIKKLFSKNINLISKSFKFINWEPKIKSLKKIINIVNFSKKNIIYLDDNISEIKQVNKFLLNENCFWLKNSYIFYLYTKSFYLSNIKKEKNKNRFNDIKSNIKRNEITDSKGILNYIKSSKVKIDFLMKKIDLKRFAEMSNKTNQFNANYKRINLKNLNLLKKKKNFYLMSFSVSDKYSNSGIIASIIIEKKNEYNQVNEFLISCRALGRDLEYIFLNQIVKKLSITDLRISFIKTERNIPFMNFMNKIKLKKGKNICQINLKHIQKKANLYEKFIKIKNN